MLGHSNLKQTSTYVNAKQVDPVLTLHAGLPLAVVDEGVDVLTGRIALRVTIEAVGEPVRKLSEPLQERPNRPLCHERQRIRPLALVQVRSFEASRTRH
jgi:hypothetical protein